MKYFLILFCIFFGFEIHGSSLTSGSASGSGAGNVVSINGDTSALQLITGSNNISASTAGGETTVNGTLLAPKANPTFTGTITTPATASRALVTGASSELAASATTATEIGYVSGVSSAIQTQLNAKQASDTQLTSIAGLSYTGNTLKVIRVNAGETDFELATVSAGVGGSTGSTDNALLRADGTGGSTLQNSTKVTLSDIGEMFDSMSGTVTATVIGLQINNLTSGNTTVFSLDGEGAWGAKFYTGGTNNAITDAGNGGVSTYVRGGNRNVGLSGITDGGNSSNRSIGVFGHAATQNSPDTVMGGYFSVPVGTGGYSIPSGYYGALVANNLTSTYDIFQARDNGTVAFSVADGGIVKMGATSATPKHIINTDTYTNGADALTLTNGPTGKAGDAAGYIKITVNGTDRAIPYW